MNRNESAALVLLIFLFVGSTSSILFSFTFSYPEAVTKPKSSLFYDTSFWNLSAAINDPLNIRYISSDVETVSADAGDVQVNITRFTYYSETYNGVDVRINSYLLRQAELTASEPALLLLHGYGSDVMQFMSIMRAVAAAGYVVMGIDAPGSGNSTDYPELNPYTLFNVTGGPQSAYLYHAVWSAARAVTYLETLPYINATIVGGASMGGMETMILSAIDDRVDGSIPMISSGSLYESLMEGSLLNSLIDPQYTDDTEQMDFLQRWFDPIAYARQFTKPTFMIFGTDDPFFVLSSIIQTVDVITAPLTLSIQPNYDHTVDNAWSDVMVRWLDTLFKGHTSYPIIHDVQQQETLSLLGWSLQVHAEVSDGSPLYVCWRTSFPGAPWELAPMVALNNGYDLDIIPAQIGKVTYYVCSMDSTGILMCSHIRTGQAGSILFPLVAFQSVIGVAVLSKRTGWKPTKEHLIREIPVLTGTLMISAGLVLPFYGISGRTDISLMDFLEVHGLVMGLSSWFLATAMFIVYYIIASAAVRHNIEFRKIVIVWLPMLILVTVAYIFFAGVFAISGGLALLYTGIGAYLLLFAIPVMLILESFVNKVSPYTKIILKVLESPPS
jgi:pimeloyl-ACP methyl ester carboxylesterase